MIDPATHLPTQELHELEMLMKQHPDEARKPSDQGIGYRRHICQWQFSGGWTIDFPGYWYEFADGDFGGLRFGEEIMMVSTYKLELKAGVERDEMELASLEDEEFVLLEFSKGEMLARLLRLKAPPGSGIFLYKIEAAAPLRRCLITFEGKSTAFEQSIPEIARSLSGGAS